MNRLFLIAASLTLAGAPALAKPARPPVDLSKLSAVYDTIAKAPAVERPQRTCAALDALKAAAPAKDAPLPQSSSVDRSTWKNRCEGLQLTLQDLAKDCPAKNMPAIEKDIAGIDALLSELISAATPKEMPPAMKQFDAALRKLWPSKHKTDCKQFEVMLGVADALVKAPAGVDAARWAKRVEGMPDFLKATQSYCSAHGDDEGSNFSEGYDQVHEHFYDLVLMLPARK